MKKNKFLTLLLMVLSYSILSSNITYGQTIAYKLATLEKGGYVTENDPLVKRFNNLLIQVDNKFTEVNMQNIGDMTYKIKEIGEQKGIKISMINVMEGATQIKGLTYAQFLGEYLTHREKGYSHDRAIEIIKSKK